MGTGEATFVVLPTIEQDPQDPSYPRSIEGAKATLVSPVRIVAFAPSIDLGEIRKDRA